MTVIAAIASEGKVIMGADSSAMDENFDKSNWMPRKIFTRGEFLIGYGASFRGGQLIEHQFKPPSLNYADDENIEEIDLDDAVFSMDESGSDLIIEADNDSYADHDIYVNYFVSAFIPALIDVFHKGEFSATEEELELIIGFRGGIYQVQSDLAVFYCHDNYASIGCGATYALASLHTTNELVIKNCSEQDRLQIALDAADYFNNGVYSPFIFESI